MAMVCLGLGILWCCLDNKGEKGCERKIEVAIFTRLCEL